MAARPKGSRESLSQRHRAAQAEAPSKAPPPLAAVPEPAPAASDGAASRIAVCLRKRPINSAEEARGERDIVSVHESESLVVVHEPKVKVDMTKYIEDHDFRFDAVFSEHAQNADVYALTARPLVATMFNGGKATCFAYGQTGSGKTHTMSGNGDGLYLLAAEDIFRKLSETRYGGLDVFVSYFEIYGGELFDLLAERKKLVAREDSSHKVCIVGLQEHHVQSVEQFFQLMEYGNAIRSTGATGVNADSSRSHAVLQIVLRKAKKEHGKLSFIDLAGSERAADTTNNDRRRRIEGAEINKSLLALKECIRALDQDKGHTPFRQSKLTQVLKDSFVCPDSRTVMIATLSPTNFAAENTLNTLRYADRVKELRSKGGAGGGAAAGGGGAVAAVDENKSANRGAGGGGGGGGARPYPHKAPAAAGGGRRAVPGPGRPSMGGGGGGGGRDEADGEFNPSAVEALVDDHAELVSVILQEKEDLILAHRQQIDDMMEVVKQEMRLLHAVDQPGSAVDDYVSSLAALLADKVAVVKRLQSRLAAFQVQLQQEETLSKSLERSLPARH